MQVIVNGNPHIDGRQAISDLLESVDALGLHGKEITRIEARLTDGNITTGTGPDDVRCTLEARPVGLDPVVVEDRGKTAHLAIQGALRKMECVLAGTFEKHDPPNGIPTVNRTNPFDS